MLSIAVRRCLSCDQRFDDRRRVCPDDGDVLISEGKVVGDAGTLIGGRYRLGNLIGEGGMGQVFEAEEIELGAPVAIKLLRPGASDERTERRFQIEAEAMAALDHPGVVKILDVGKTDTGTAYIVMERLFGPTFTELRRAGKFASPERVVELMREACDVVAAAHARGIVHRDLKPSNLLLHRIDKERSVVKVLDFGIAKFLGRAGEGLTVSGEMVGTIMYMAPEQSGHGGLTAAADVYSLGAILFEALAGRLPFAARTATELIWLQASAPIPALSTFRPDVSDELDKLVAHCLSKKPDSRFADAGELGRALGSVRPVRSAADAPAAERAFRVNPALWVGAVLDERYELHEWISPGRFGSHVYLATHNRTGASVAVRFWATGPGAMRDLLIDAFRNEARAMSVRHENLISIVDLGFTDEGAYLVTELVESRSLRALLDARGSLPPAVARDLVAGAVSALARLHAAKIVSGGLSPETIRVTGPLDRPEKMLISPFGLTNLRQVQSLLTTIGPDAEGERALDYISPEQRSGHPPDARSDLYSTGLIFAEMLGARIHEPITSPTRTARPSAARTPQPFVFGPRIPDPVLPDDLSDDLREFLTRATARDPLLRFQTAEEFLEALPRIY